MTDQKDLIYNGFAGSIEASVEDECLFGRIRFIDDLISYEGNTVAELNSAFIAAVDRYLEHCKCVGKPPNKSYSGTFNVRVGPELHKQAAQKASSLGLSLNQYLTNIVKMDIQTPQQSAKTDLTHYPISGTFQMNEPMLGITSNIFTQTQDTQNFQQQPDLEKLIQPYNH